jgi:hypothetical protein
MGFRVWRKIRGFPKNSAWIRRERVKEEICQAMAVRLLLQSQKPKLREGQEVVTEGEEFLEDATEALPSWPQQDQCELKSHSDEDDSDTSQHVGIFFYNVE